MIDLDEAHIQAGAAPGLSVCLFCGSSNAAAPAFLHAAARFGGILAEEGVRLVYGGGGGGLMGAAARAANAGGGAVLGVMPTFLRRSELVYDEVPTTIVANMHDRKRIMFEHSDAFAVFPGGVGTLEEVMELLSWRRLDLHRKPIVFLDIEGFWRPLFALLDATIEQGLTPAWMTQTWRSVTHVEEVLPAVIHMRAVAASGPGFDGYAERDAELAAKA